MPKLLQHLLVFVLASSICTTNAMATSIVLICKNNEVVIASDRMVTRTAFGKCVNKRFLRKIVPLYNNNVFLCSGISGDAYFSMESLAKQAGKEAFTPNRTMVAMESRCVVELLASLNRLRYEDPHEYDVLIKSGNTICSMVIVGQDLQKRLEVVYCRYTGVDVNGSPGMEPHYSKWLEGQGDCMFVLGVEDAIYDVIRTDAHYPYRKPAVLTSRALVEMTARKHPDLVAGGVDMMIMNHHSNQFIAAKSVKGAQSRHRRKKR